MNDQHNRSAQNKAAAARWKRRATIAKSETAQDWQAAYSARYILAELDNEAGMKALANLTGYPFGVISAAFDNFFPGNRQESPLTSRIEE
tara:strand:+ start:747 stop:1016 length:270 start_codon:yes stop_codon:yes gene_type:complete